MRCPKCFSNNYIKSGNINKKQRYKCCDCKCQFTQSEKPGVHISMKMQVAVMFLCGISMNKLSEVFGVAPPTIMRWIHYLKEKLGDDFQKADSIPEIFSQEDFLCSFKILGNKKDQ